jgi:hypothetical protein
MFEEEFLNNVMERYNTEFDGETYRIISAIFVEEHLKFLKQRELQIKSQIEGITRILESVQKGVV